MPATPPCQRRSRIGASRNGMEPLAKEAYRSHTVVTVKNELKWDISALNKFLLTRGMRIANGYGKIKDLTFRVATMGETSLATWICC